MLQCFTHSRRRATCECSRLRAGIFCCCCCQQCMLLPTVHAAAALMAMQLSSRSSYDTSLCMSYMILLVHRMQPAPACSCEPASAACINFIPACCCLRVSAAACAACVAQTSCPTQATCASTASAHKSTSQRAFRSRWAA
jgi:hypothetical protein